LKLLAKSLEHNTALSQLDLSWCSKIGLDTGGVAALVIALNKNRTMANIALTGCPCTTAGDKRITALVGDLMVLLQSNSRRPRSLAGTAVGDGHESFNSRKTSSHDRHDRNRTARFDTRTAETVQMTLRATISNGAQLYNMEDGEACLKLFMATAEHLYNMLHVEVLAQAMERCRGLGARNGLLNIQDRAWILRCAFDSLLEDVERDLHTDVRQ